MKPAKPRHGRYMGAEIVNVECGSGTWIEGEEFAYPAGGMTRRALAMCDGELRLVHAGISDTFWTIPGYRVVKGKRVKGYLSHAEDERGQYLKFEESK